MKVKEALKYLSEYKNDEEIFIEWWTKEHMETNMGKEISDEVWETAIRETYRSEYWSEAVIQTLSENISEEEEALNV